jgi:hypothetical protein
MQSQPSPAYQQPVYQQPAYSGQVPPGPSDPYAVQPEAYGEPYAEPVPEAPKKSNRTLIYIGCGCLIVMLCCLVVAAFAFDYMNLYCEPPFNTIFSCNRPDSHSWLDHSVHRRPGCTYLHPAVSFFNRITLCGCKPA